MKNGLYFPFLSAFLLLFASCEKVINVDLKDADQKVVIEGNIIDDSTGNLSHLILLSKTKKFTADNQRVPVIGATVIVEDVTVNRADTFKEQVPGSYFSKNISGVQGHTYKLTALIEGKTYTATSTMPDLVPFDSLYVDDFTFFGSVVKQVIPVFQDPPGVKNYYRFSVQVGDSLLNRHEAWDDRLTDGKINSRPYNVFDEELFKGNDTLLMTMECIDKGVYDFFNTLENASGGGGGQTPGNPISNISGGAMGYFGAKTLRKRTIIIP